MHTLRQPTTRPHPAIPSVLVTARPGTPCRNCGDPIRAGERTGTYRGAEMHQVCALELRLNDAETELAEVHQLAQNAMANALFAQ